MARPPPRPSFDASRSLKRYGLAFGRDRLRVSNGAPALVKERLETFAAAFLADPTPGLVFEYDRLVLANDAARGLLGTAAIAVTDEFLERLKASFNRSRFEPGLELQTPSGVYAPVLQQASTRGGHPTLICFLVKQRTVDPAFESLSERQLGVVSCL